MDTSGSWIFGIYIGQITPFWPMESNKGVVNCFQNSLEST